MAGVFKIGFKRIWGRENAAPDPEDLDVDGEAECESRVGALNAEDAIRKVREAEVGYVDEDEDEDTAAIVGVAIVSVEFEGALDLA